MLSDQRHSTATLANVGTPKVVACADYYAQIAPWVTVEPVIALFGLESAPELLAGILLPVCCTGDDETDVMNFLGNPDWVVDAIDNIDSKVNSLSSSEHHDSDGI